MKQIHSAGLVLFAYSDETIEYLILQYIGKHWDFPKGKIESGETKEEAALRELKEETGLDATILPGFCRSLTYVFTDLDRQRAHKQVDLLVARTIKRPIILSDEHIDFGWFSYERALERLTYPNARTILQEAHAHILSTLQK